MPESSDNPTPEQKPGGIPPIAGNAGSTQPVLPAPRTSRGTPPVESGDAQISLSQLIALAKSLSGGEVEEEAEDRGVISRGQRKFARAEARTSSPRREEDDPEQGPLEGERLVLPGGDPADSAPAPLPSMTVRAARRSRSSSRGPGPLVPLLIVGAVTIAGLLIFKLMRSASPPPTIVPELTPGPVISKRPAAGELTAHESETLDKIAEARKANDLSKAQALCVMLRSEGSTIHGLSYQEAQLAIAMGDLPAAAMAVNRSLDLNEEVAGCYILRAALLARQGKLDATTREYAAAAAADPFSPKAYFFWGEALRRAGRPQAALVRLGQAIARAPDADSEELYRFKERLTLIEIGRGAEFADELKTRLAANPPTPDWLITAAAQELKASKFEAAASYMDRAAALLPPAAFVARLRDSYLFGFAHEPALARVYAAAQDKPRPPQNPLSAAAPQGTPAPEPEDPVLPVVPAPDLAKPGADRPAARPRS